MELLQTDGYYILNNKQDSLWFNRKDGTITSKTCWDLADAHNPQCLGIVYGFLGKIQILPDVPPRICLVTSSRVIGQIESPIDGCHNVHSISKVVFLPLNGATDCDLMLSPCHKHHTQHPKSMAPEKRNILPFGDLQQKVGLSKTFGTIRNVTSTLKTATASVAASATGQNKNRRDLRDKERYERRILDELYKMFNESDSFYYCEHGDITSSLQRQTSPSYDKNEPLWKRADDRFFWNKNMLQELIQEEAKVPDFWITPIIQGFFQIESVPIESPEATSYDSLFHKDISDRIYTLILISRRSRWRAGTRYKRRGVDEDGNVANYVETEQIVKFSHHQVAFIQVRGSVPLFWSQPGYKYRPPPRIDKSAEETAPAFRKHFEKELQFYEKIVCVSLVDQGGKEKVIADSYLDQIFSLNCPNITYISFDFHEYCRGMRYENVSVLIEDIKEIISKMSYCWVDKEGLICKQLGVFRINCIDCLDRTNVLQTALAKTILENQFVKLGIIAPDHQLPLSCRTTLQVMWANNGDVVSKQYAGTSALKGDFTRTGERKFTGLMKDGMNSANRYYMNRFKDAYRQATIDTMLGNPVTQDLINLPEIGEEEDISLAQHVKHVIDDCKTLLVPDAQTILGAWGLIDADPVSCDTEQTDMDTILVLTRDSYYIAQYDEATDRILQFERVSLIDLDTIEYGPYTFQGMFKQPKTFFCIRLNYQVDGQMGYFHMFRSMNIRFFNNMAVTIRTPEEIVESIKAIADTFEVAVGMIGCEAKLISCKLERKKSRRRTQLSNPLHFLMPIASFTKKSPDSLKNAGTRAFSNVTSGLAKLNPISSLRVRKAAGPAQELNSQFYPECPLVSVSAPRSPCQMVKDQYLTSCGIVSSCVVGANISSGAASPPLIRSQSYSGVAKLFPASGGQSTNRSNTPEIMVSLEASDPVETKFTPRNFLTTISSPRVRKLSHSSDEVDPRDEDGDKMSMQRASSATELDLPLHMSSSHSEGGILSTRQAGTHSPLSPLSPLYNLNKGAVLAPFSVLAKGVQSLAPGAGKFARGMQSIGGNVDPRKLKIQRQVEINDNVELKSRRANCKSRIILF